MLFNFEDKNVVLFPKLKPFNLLLIKLICSSKSELNTLKKEFILFISDILLFVIFSKNCISSNN
jgi:hypothetical protein